jgi:hypothetical protein
MEQATQQLSMLSPCVKHLGSWQTMVLDLDHELLVGSG